MLIKVQRNWVDVRTALQAALEAYCGSAADLSRAAEIDYFSARRYLKRPPENQTESARQLCIYFNIDLFLQDPGLQEIVEAAVEVWDRTPEHARLIKELLKWSKTFGKANDEIGGGEKAGHKAAQGLEQPTPGQAAD
jgi:hypothetical protein